MRYEISIYARLSAGLFFKIIRRRRVELSQESVTRIKQMFSQSFIFRSPFPRKVVLSARIRTSKMIQVKKIESSQLSLEMSLKTYYEVSSHPDANFVRPTETTEINND